MPESKLSVDIRVSRRNLNIRITAIFMHSSMHLVHSGTHNLHAQLS